RDAVAGKNPNRRGAEAQRRALGGCLKTPQLAAERHIGQPNALVGTTLGPQASRSRLLSRRRYKGTENIIVGAKHGTGCPGAFRRQRGRDARGPRVVPSGIRWVLRQPPGGVGVPPAFVRNVAWSAAPSYRSKSDPDAIPPPAP